MMNDIFRTLIAEGIVVVYLDDILIFMETEKEHEQAVWRVLEVLAEHKLFLCLEKCEFYQKRIEYLSQTSFGHISINSPSILTVSMATESP